MESISPLQVQYPLSPRKFWKKMFPNIVGMSVLGVLLGAALVTAFAFSFKFSLLGSIAFALIIVLVLIAIILTPYALYYKAYIKRYYYAGEEHFITIKKGVFTPSEIHVQYQKIQDVYVDQDLLDRIMGLYDVHISSATVTSGIEAHIDGVNKQDAEGLKKFFLDKMVAASRGGQDQPSQQNGAPVPPAAPSLNLTEEISSKTYPLSSSWVGLQVASKIFGAIVTGLIITLYFGIKVGTGASIGMAVLWVVGISFVFALIRLVGFFLWKSNYAFNFTPEHIYFKAGVLSVSENHMPYSSIQDVTVAQTFIERIFGFAKVSIENAASQTVMTKQGPVSSGGGVLLVGLSLVNANKITSILKSSVLGRNTARFGL